LGLWVIEYWDVGSSAFIPFQAVWDQTNEELDGDCYATFYIANSAVNRALIQQDLLVAVWFDDALVFSGTLSGGDISSTRIKAVIYDTVMLTLDEAEPISGVYDQKPASTIAADIVAGTGISVGPCPSTPVSVVFYNANRLDCFKFLADALNLDLFSTDGTTVNLAVKGSGVVWTPSSISVSSRGLDRSKQRTKVIVRGIDCWGNHILGVAGSGVKVTTFSQNTATDQATLNGIAASKLAEVNTDSSGMPISVLITVGKAYATGDSVSIVNAQYCLDGTYRIMQLNKTRTQVKLQLDKFRKSVDRTIADLRSWEAQGIYLPGATSWSLNLQGLVGLYHLNEGSGTVAKDGSPRDTPVDGTIVGRIWQQGPVTMMLTLDGTGWVDCGASIDFHASTKFSVGAWFSPSANDSTMRFVAHKDGQFALFYYVNTGVVTFSFTDASNVGHTFNSDAGIAVVGARLFFMVTYDGVHLKMYVNGVLHKTFSQTGAPHSSANTVYIGMFLKGVVAESMFWQRCLVDQEVLELYFFPLNRVVKKGGAGGLAGWGCAIDVNDPNRGSTTPSGSQTVAAGASLTVTANPLGGCIFSVWQFDGANYSTANPVTVPAQVTGGFHDLVAIFVGQIGVGAPILSSIGSIVNTQVLSPVLSAIGAIVNTQILSPVIASMSTIVSVSVDVAKWWVDCAYEIHVAMSPVGLQVVASGGALAVSASISSLGATLGYVFPLTNPFKLDGTTNVGTVASNGLSASYTIPSQTNNTLHQIVAIPVIGWRITTAGTTSVGNFLVASGGTYFATRSGTNTKWYLDGTLVFTGTTYTVPTQTNGTYHTLTCTT
jgi:hypothetical protein